MPTINEVIERVSRIKPVVNVDDPDKARWLIELDGRIWLELIKKSYKGQRGPIGPLPICPVCGAQSMKGAIPPKDYQPPEIGEGEEPPEPWGICYDKCTDTNGCWVCGYTDALAEPPREWPDDGDVQLLVPTPYDRLYDLYLIAMLEFTLREYSSYNNSMAAFNDALEKFSHDYRGTHMPVSHGDFINIFP